MKTSALPNLAQNSQALPGPTLRSSSTKPEPARQPAASRDHGRAVPPVRL